MTTARALFFAFTLALCGCSDSSFTGASNKQPVTGTPVVKPQSTDAKPGAKPQAVPPGTDAGADIGSGSAEAAGPSTTAPSTTAPATTIPPILPTDCGAAGATQARLLTPVLDVTAADAHLEYEIYRTDCDGVIQQFAADKILFDMDAWGAYSDMSATLTQDATPVATTLKLTIGSDLFGHTGEGWAHQETADKVAVQGNSKSVRLRIELAGRQLSPREAPAAGPAADGSVPIATYLRFGDAAPVQVDVKALHPGPPPAAATPPVTTQP